MHFTGQIDLKDLDEAGAATSGIGTIAVAPARMASEIQDTPKAM
jgi:hypothetical protein